MESKFPKKGWNYADFSKKGKKISFRITACNYFEVTKKTKVELPQRVKGIVKCMNPNCITNHEAIETDFSVVQNPDVKLKCHFCEKFTTKENMEFL